MYFDYMKEGGGDKTLSHTKKKKGRKQISQHCVLLIRVGLCTAQKRLHAVELGRKLCLQKMA